MPVALESIIRISVGISYLNRACTAVHNIEGVIVSMIIASLDHLHVCSRKWLSQSELASCEKSEMNCVVHYVTRIRFYCGPMV